jgi:threonine dehydrogenase-like Zn-dependent dehydrogenase
MRARALWVVGPGRAELRDEDLPEPGPGQVVVRALFSGVSRGTESLVLAGRVPEGQHGVMRAPFQAGDFPWPVKYGYISVGLADGRPVFCLYPHQDAYVVPADAVVPLPPDLPPERAVLAANLETAITGVWDAPPGPGDRVTVVGAGVVGLLTTWLIARIPGTDVQVVDLVEDRRTVVEALGARFSTPDAATGDRDLVVDATGAAGGLRTALALAGHEATVLALSWYGAGDVPVPLGEAFHSRRLVLRSSQVGSVPPGRRGRWTHRRRVELALSMLAAAPELDALIDSEGDFASLPEDLPRVAGASGRVLCHRVRYPEGA